jgi:PKD repeat protein
MSSHKAMLRIRWLAITLLALLLIAAGGRTGVTLGSTPPHTYGDIPLDPATYQRYLKAPSPSIAADLPAAYDARDDGIITASKDQASCGGCWAFASAGAMESHLLAAGLPFNPTDLSEQQQLSCNGGHSGCCGGSMSALQYWETRGPVYETCFPWGDASTSCPTHSVVPCSPPASNCPQLGYRVTNYHTVASDQFRQSLYADGPSYWRFDVYSDFQNWYNTAASGSVYVNGAGTTEEGGHAVLLIGWDDARSAYLCKNSWGATTGPQGDGTFWIAYSGHANDLGFGMANFDVVSVNHPPVADAGGLYTGDEGAPVAFDGTGSSDADGSALTYQWDFGDGSPVVTSAAPSHTYDDDAVYDVCLTVSDLEGETDQDCTTATIANVAPSATFNHPIEVDEGSAFDLSLTGPYDPSNADTTAGFEYAFDCGAGYGSWTTTSSATCQTYDNGILAAGGKIRDKDGGASTYTASVTVNNLPPVVTVDTDSQTLQYSDYLCDVTFTATDVAADTLTATPDFLPVSLGLTGPNCTPSADGIWQTCTWTLEGTLDEPQGSYTVNVTVADEDGGSAVADTEIIVELEDATIWLEEDNPVAIKVDTPGGDSPAFSLTAHVQETTPDVAVCGADPGAINLAQVRINLVPVGPGSTITALCSETGVVGAGYDAILTVACAFDNIPVNTYWVQAVVIGDYYVSGLAEDVLVIYDPSLGFTTGGGWFYWPDTGERTNFGYTMKYNRPGQNIQGSFLLIRHLADGTIYRVKSNALLGLSIGTYVVGEETVDWASFSGKATYLEPGWLEPIGNHRFITYVEDRNEPGAGFDRFWIEIQKGSKITIPVMSMNRPTVDNTVILEGGNIVVPHTPDNRQ